MKKYFIILLLLAGGTFSAFARDFTYTYEGQTLTYTVISETAKTCTTKNGDYSGGTMIGSNKVSGDLIIPEIADGFTVTEIGYGTFCSSDGLTSVIIPETVTSIGWGAFSDCSSLVSVVIPNSVSSIDSGCFSGCSSLSSISIPETVTSIGNYAFYECSGLKYAEFSSIKSLCSIAFENQYANPLSYAHRLYIGGEEVTKVEIPDGITSLNYTFYGCSGLTSIVIPNSVTSLGNRCFLECRGLTTINIPNSVTSLGAYCFGNCLKLKSITIPPSVKKIGEGAFLNCDLDPLIIQGEIEKNEDSFYGLRYSHIFCLTQYYSTIKSMTTRTVTPYPVSVTCDSYYYGGAKISIEPTSEMTAERYADYFNFKDFSYQLHCDEQPFDSETAKKDYFVKGLKPKTDYNYSVSYEIVNQDLSVLAGTYYDSFTTREPSLTYNYSSATQTVIKDFYPVCPSDESVTPANISYTINGKTYDYSGSSKNIGSLTPDTKYPFTIKADYNGKILTYNGSIKTKSVISGEKIQMGPTSAELEVKIDAGNATIKNMFWSYNGNKLDGERPILTGLVPSKSYSFDLTINYSNGGSNKYTYNKKTDNLQLKILDPKCTTSTTAILGALTNISEVEPNVGFQWKKYDAPATLKPNEAYAPVCDGMIEGFVKNLQSTSYYNVRAFYKNAAGDYTYTDWVTFDPSDFSYFEPTVRTYAVTEVNGNSVTLHGYALQGSDDIISQGFEYEMTGTETSRVHALAATSGTIIAKGQVMSATLTDLPDGEYIFKAFVQTSAGYTYGEPQTFIINFAGVENVEIDNADNVEIIGYYDLNGRRFDALQRGFNIVVYSNGKTEKLIRP